MNVINNAKFVAIRERFAGRRAEPTGLICERCPTPDIMDYGSHVNRRVAVFITVQTLEFVRRWGAAALARLRRRPAAVDTRR